MTAREDDLARALARVCLAPEPAAEDLAALRDDPARWRLYRDLVRARVFDALAEALPRTREAATPARFDAWCARWLAEAPPRARHLRGLMPEFADWLAAAAVARDGLPPYLDDLLRYERALHAVALAPDPSPAHLAAAPFAMDRPARLHPALARVDSRWELHRGAPAGAIPAGETALLIYRDATRFTAEALALSPIAAAVVDAMRAGDRSAADAVGGALAARGLAPSEAFLDSLAGLLAELIERGVILGSAP